MAQVRFYPMRIDFQKLKDLVAQYSQTPDNFAYLVFQPENPDSHANRDEYDLTAYVVGNDGIAHEPVGLPFLRRDLDREHLKVHDKKVALGNYPLSITKIKSYINGPGGGLIDYLVFVPKPYEHDPRYVSYSIISVNKKPYNITEQIQVMSASTSSGDDLNPCPPNQPGQ